MQKTNFKTRLLALLTAVFMVIMCVPFAAFAEDAELKSITVSFIDEGKKTVANDEDVASGDYLTTPSASMPAGKTFDRWKVEGDTEDTVNKGYIGVGNYVSFADLAKFAVPDATNPTHGRVNLIALAAKEPEQPSEPEKTPLTKENVSVIKVYWNDDQGVYKMDPIEKGKSASAPAVDMNAKEYNYTWTAYGLDKELSVGDTISFDELLEIASEPQYDYVDGVEDTNTVIAAVNFTKKDKVVEPVEPAKKPLVMTNVTKINVYWCDGEGANGVYKMDPVSVNGSTVAPAVDMNAKEYNYKWVATGKELNVNDTITFSELLAIASEPQYDVKADGTLDYNTVIASVTFDKKDNAKPAKALVETNISKIYVSWYDGEGENGVYKMDPVDFGKTVTAPATDINAERYNYTWNVDELVKNVNDVVTFGELLQHCGKPMYDLNADGTENNQKVVAYVTFVKTDVAAEVGIKNVHFIVKNGEGESWAASEKDYNDQKIFDRTYTVRSDVTGKVTAPAAAVKEGKNFLYWECTQGTTPNVKKYRLNAGAEFNFDTLTNLGLSKDESGDFNFVAVFEDKKADNSSSSSSSASSSSNKTTTASNEKQVVKAAAAPANTTKVLPKTGASNVAPLLGGSLAVVALLMGYGVYSLVLRKKD